MLPVIAIVGRANVGKSTLFNNLTKTRSALVADFPGVTRDRQYGEAKFENRTVLLVDTGGIFGAEDAEMTVLMEQQVDEAIADADLILFVVDARKGLLPADEVIAARLRRIKKPIFVLANKADNGEVDILAQDFYAFGLGEPFPVAARRGRGIKQLISHILPKLPELAEEESVLSGIKIAVLGRPNVGKSTLVNRMLGEDRMIVSDRPGTTRDAIFIPFVHQGKPYTLIDTAGIRRRSKIHDTIEKFSILKSLQAIHEADVVILVIDGSEGVTEQDSRLLGFILEAGTPLVIAVNKWDGLSAYDRQRAKATLDRKLAYVDFARTYFISALHGSGVGDLYEAIHQSYDAVNRELSTADLTRTLEFAVADHEPPLSKGRRIRLRYAHFGGRHPFTIVIHGKQTENLPRAYSRYLASCFRKAFRLVGVPIHIKLKTDDNPYHTKK